jgi:hypothetical protein
MRSHWLSSTPASGARFALVIPSTVLDAEDWPHWRGPTASGVSPSGAAVKWSDTENVAWKARIRGLGVSSPIVSRDLVFVTSQAGAGVVRPGPRLVQSGNAADAGERPLGGSAAGSDGKAVFLVTAFDRMTGRPRWEYELPAEGDLPAVHEKHNLASPSPVSDGERVYAWFATGRSPPSTPPAHWYGRRTSARVRGLRDQLGHGSSRCAQRSVDLLCYHDKASYLLALDARPAHSVEAGSRPPA